MKQVFNISEVSENAVVMGLYQSQWYDDDTRTYHLRWNKPRFYMTHGKDEKEFLSSWMIRKTNKLFFELTFEEAVMHVFLEKI